MSHLVSVAQLLHLQRTAERGEGAAVRLLDVRWRLDLPEGRPDYVRAHLPGAVYVDLERELARRADPRDGSHPLPTRADLQRSARSWGISAGDIVVAYDDNRGVPAARLWWLLRGGGIDVRVLDGGIRAWAAELLPLESGDARSAPGDVVLLGEGDRIGALRIEDVDGFVDRGVLLDVRTPEQYSGAQVSTGTVGGHIPGAVNLPAMAAVAADGRLHRPEVLRRIFSTAGIRDGVPVAVYCSSGVAAMHTALALEHAGYPARVYAGSWSQWVNTRGRAVATGALPAARLTRA
ncbi:sulfurtransferase [uncultured Microbacterium sp.]|uniref:sulfurtransferase n=1 Tax=uncultured Microbacterium sp. TaxID=191216 RepID=UPI0026339A6E|nr:sulfurtransferase [uncultured Microbacterium sp.]